MTPAKTATQIDRPERFHVEVSNPAEMHEFLERGYGAKVRLCNKDSVRGDRPSLIHMRTDVGPFAIEEVQLRGDIEASTDPINKVVGVFSRPAGVRTGGTRCCPCRASRRNPK